MRNNETPITYVGSFPPPYGGVTIKNALLFECLSNHVPIDKLDLSCVKMHKPHACIRFLRSIFSRKGALILGVAGNWRRKLTTLLYMFNKKKMQRSLLIVMGGAIIKDSNYIAKLNHFKRIYVETESMKKGFESHGATNVSVYPNCRKRQKGAHESVWKEGRKVDFVFFSSIEKNKGADVVLEAATTLSEANFHFYGKISPDYSEEFLEKVNKLENVYYHGIFDSMTRNASEELGKYDVHLFPTQWSHEGVPGVIVESKIAGIPTIATNRAYNKELVNDGITGFIMQSDTPEELARLLRKLLDNPARLRMMKEESLRSAEPFYVDAYLDSMAAELFSER